MPPAPASALRDANKTSSLGTYVASLGTLARTNDFADEIVFAIEDAPLLLSDDTAVLAGNNHRMSPVRAAFLKALNRDKEKVRAIVRGPRDLAAAEVAHQREVELVDLRGELVAGDLDEQRLGRADVRRAVVRPAPALLSTVSAM